MESWPAEKMNSAAEETYTAVRGERNSLLSMKKFAVRLEGTGCRARIRHRPRLLVQRSSADETLGFFTTRFVEADSAFNAGKCATELVREELKGQLLNKPDEPWVLTIDEIWEDPENFKKHAPGSGFTWYSDDPNDLCDGDAEIPESDQIV